MSMQSKEVVEEQTGQDASMAIWKGAKVVTVCVGTRMRDQALETTS